MYQIKRVFFYKGKWTANVDNLLLSNVIRMRGVHPWEGNNIPDAVIAEAATSINQAIGGEFTITDLNIRLKVLEECFTTFNKVVATAGVHWNMPDKIIEADDEVWKTIFQV